MTPETPITVTQGSDWEYGIALASVDPETKSESRMFLGGCDVKASLRKTINGPVLMDLAPTIDEPNSQILFETVVPQGSPLVGMHFFDVVLIRPDAPNPETILIQPVDIRAAYTSLT